MKHQSSSIDLLDFFSHGGGPRMIMPGGATGWHNLTIPNWVPGYAAEANLIEV